MCRGCTGDSVHSTLFVVGIRVLQTLAHDHAEFDFIVQAYAFGAEDVVWCAGGEEGGGGFQEEEWLLGAHVVEFGDVVSA